MLKKLLFILSFSLLFSGQISAQVTSATISGVVRDETGAVLPGATVRVRNLETGMTRTAVTDEQGRYHAANLSLGSYEVEASLAGFQTEVRSGIKLTIGREAIVDFTLKVGEITEKVVVTSEAPLVETTVSMVSGLVDDKKIRDLPLNARSFMDLALLQTGIKWSRVASGTETSYGTMMSISGARPNSNVFMLDGTEITDMWTKGTGVVTGRALGVEAVREFRVLTHNYSAEQGKASGGIVNVVTRSGTNEFHGSVFEFHRNDNLDARNFFDREPIGKPEFKRNQFGFTAGGPIRKDRTFFFGNYEGLRDRLGRTVFARVPTELARQGIVQDARTGEFRRIEIKPAVKPYLELYPLPTAGGRAFGDGTAEHISSIKEPIDQDYFSIRIDHKLSDSDSFFARYTLDRGLKHNPNPPYNLFAVEDSNKNQYVTLEETKIISPRLLNAFRFGYTRQPISLVNVPLVDVSPALSLVPGQLMPSLSPTPLSGIGPDDGRPRIFTRNLFEFIDNLTYARGMHSLKAGIQIQRDQQNIIFATRQRGRWTFSTLENFLQGRASGVQFAPPRFADPHRAFRQSLYGFFVQDDIRLRSNFTLNLGLRYEFTTTLREKHGKQPYLPNELLLTGSNADIRTIPPWYINPELKNFAPRVGFAWDVRGDGKMAIRGGFGIFYDHILPGWISSVGAWRMGPFYPILDARTLPDGSPLPFPLVEEEMIRIFGAESRTIYQIEFRPSSVYAMHYNLTIQREMAPDTILKLGYIGSRGIHLPPAGRLDGALPIEILPDGRPRFGRRPTPANPNYEAIRMLISNSDSFYNALELEVNKKFSRGFQFQGSYTLSKAMDDASGQRPSDVEQTSDQRPDFRKLLYRGLSDHDVRHNFVLNFTYDLPSPATAINRILGGWQLNGLIAIASGHPFTVTQGSDAFSQLLIVNRPDLALGQRKIVLGGPDRYFDPSAFSFSDPQFFGTVGRNTVIGPGLVNVDFSLIKNVFAKRISESFHLQLRAELFNLFNRANFRNPSSRIFDSQGRPDRRAGQITGTTTTSRQIQFGLKLLF